MVIVGLTIIVLPFPSNVPPQEPLYQYQSAPVPNNPPVIPRVADSLSHMIDEVAVIELTETELTKIKELIKEPNIYGKLIYNVAPLASSNVPKTFVSPDNAKTSPSHCSNLALVRLGFVSTAIVFYFILNFLINYKF